MREESRPINGMPQLLTGSQPIDGGHTIFTADQARVFLTEEPAATPYLRPFVGAREYLQGGERFILTLHGVSPSLLRQLSRVRERLARVRSHRQTSKRTSTLKLADTPALWQVNVIRRHPFWYFPK